jgi:hypothetical protein
MITVIATTFPKGYNYGPLEEQILNSTVRQVDFRFPNEKNLLLNMTWFGPQFNNGYWQQLEKLLIVEQKKFDNLILLSTIDPVYLDEKEITEIIKLAEIKKVFRIGTWEDSYYEWNWHAGAAHILMRIPEVSDIQLERPDHVFVCYQRKPRLHRVEFTNLLLEQGFNKRGIVTLGGGSQEYADIYAEGTMGPNITLKENLDEFVIEDNCGGIPCDLLGLGPLTIWRRHFLNIVSETEFNNWHPRFVTEKTWKPIVGLRPFIIHGQTRIYSWLRNQGFKTFNNYWPMIPIETSEDQHGSVMSVLHWLCDMSTKELEDMYQDMLPDLYHNRNRFKEFAAEQYFKMHNVFDNLQ